MKPYFQALRLERWPRSLAIVIGSAAFFFLNRDTPASFGTVNIIWRVGLAFFLTWGISTANYIINEIVDAPFDRHHPTKRHRPLVSGRIKPGPLLALFLLIISVCFLLAGLFCAPFLFSLLALLAAGFIYNIKPIRTKDIPFLDSISESANNPIRFLIGWFAFAPAGLFPPISLLLCWWFFGNFLLIAKRLSEKRFLKEKAADYRSSLSKYTVGSLIFGMAVSTGLFFLFYFHFALANKLESFILLSPLLLFFYFLIFEKTLKEKGVMEEPERLLKHPRFAVYSLLIVIAFVLSLFFDKIHQ